LKRNQIVLIVIVAALGLMFWSGYHNYQRRKAEQRASAQVPTPVAGVPDAANQTVAQDVDSDEGLPTLRGKKAPAFTLKNTDGKRVSLADYKGKAVLINFWATWCAPCKIEMPWFIDLQKQYEAQGFTVIGISEDDKKDHPEVAKFKDKIGVNYPILLGDDAVGKAYGGLEFLPTTYYVGRNGKIVEETAGLASKDVIEAHIKKALAAGE
jgi:peroxiredoxin